MCGNSVKRTLIPRSLGRFDEVGKSSLSAQASSSEPGRVRARRALSSRGLTAQRLIHRTEEGHLVRSKSELVIANMLFQLKIPYEYERVLDGTTAAGRLRPDFSFVTADGVLVWEHFGMLSRPNYQRGWEWKRASYAKNGFAEGRTLFTSTEEDGKGLDSVELRKTALVVKGLLE